MSESSAVEVTLNSDQFIAISDLIELLGAAGEYALIDVREAVSVQHSGTPLVAVQRRDATSPFRPGRACTAMPYSFGVNNHRTYH